MANSLKPATLDPSYETLAVELYELACCGARSLWSELSDGSSLQNETDLRMKFVALAHRGMRDAQNIIVERLTESGELSTSVQYISRLAADSMAWPLIGDQLCYARRLYKEQRPQDIRETNLESVLTTAKSFYDKDPDSFALVSDLTSFVQVGDLLVASSTQSLSIVEVKEGKVNKKICDFLDFYEEAKCPRAFQYFMETEDTNTVKQLQRTVRQTSRMLHAVETMRSGESIDPDNGQGVIIPEEFFFVDTWDDELLRIINESEDRGWALSVIDDCLFLGCYSGAALKKGGFVVFNTWFDHCGGSPESPRFSILDSLGTPLAKPLFNRPMPEKYKFDILFGRKHVCIGLSIENLIKNVKNQV